MNELVASGLPIELAMEPEVKDRIDDVLVEGELARRWKQVRRVAAFTGSLSASEFIDIATARLSAHPRDAQISLSHDRLCHPFHLTAAKSDLSVYAEVVVMDTYRMPEELDGLINGRPIIDIGGNIGTTAAIFASRYPDSPMLSIEPNRRNYDYLQTNTKPYGTRINVLQGALSLWPGMVSLANPEVKAFGGHSLYRYSSELQASDRRDSASAIIPEDLFSVTDETGDIGLLKVDIEGAEVEIFKSRAINPLFRKSKVVVVETHDFAIAESSAVVLEAGYRNGLELFKRQKGVLFFANKK